MFRRFEFLGVARRGRFGGWFSAQTTDRLVAAFCCWDNDNVPDCRWLTNISITLIQGRTLSWVTCCVCYLSEQVSFPSRSGYTRVNVWHCRIINRFIHQVIWHPQYGFRLPPRVRDFLFHVSWSCTSQVVCKRSEIECSMSYRWVRISLISVFKCLNYSQFKELYFFEDATVSESKDEIEANSYS